MAKKSRFSKQQRRFEAEWISRQHRDAHGEWNPDLDEYTVSYHLTLDTAVAEAVKQGKAAAQAEWWCVSEQRWLNSEWLDVRRWNGDWDGNMNEAYDNRMEAAPCE